MNPDYLSANRNLWNTYTHLHTGSAFYDVAGFRAGATSLQAPELGLLGSVAGEELLHLQCHFGQDTLSLARMGARVTGLDLSPDAIQYAHTLAEELSLSASFVCGNVLEMDTLLGDRTFDTIFTSYGALPWLPELQTWGSLIARYLKPGGRFVLVEFHPVIWMYDNVFSQVVYSYFNREVIAEEEHGSYADQRADTVLTSYTWNHSLAEVFQALLSQGLRISRFEEYDTSPYNCFQRTVAVPGGYQIEGLAGRIPMVYALEARKDLV
jgi:ubiquinone/menaquinone biosynthesis C-methylase UbiE